MDQTVAQMKAEAMLGAGLVTTPFWVWLLQATSLVASTIVAVCGAIIAINAVWRMYKRRRARPTI